MTDDLEISVAPNWAEMVQVNERAHDFLAAADLDDDATDTFTMVACELVENAIKYGDSRATNGAGVDLLLQILPKMIIVQVRNRIAQRSQFHLKKLDRTLQWIRGFQDPFQAYIERLRQISREPSGQETSGLGIVRIAYEARAAIDFVLGEDDTLSVSAVAPRANGTVPEEE